MHEGLAAICGIYQPSNSPVLWRQDLLCNLHVFANLTNLAATHRRVIRVFAPCGVRQVVLPVAVSTTFLSEPENEMATSWEYIGCHQRIYRNVSFANLRLWSNRKTVEYSHTWSLYKPEDRSIHFRRYQCHQRPLRSARTHTNYLGSEYEAEPQSETSIGLRFGNIVRSFRLQYLKRGDWQTLMQFLRCEHHSTCQDIGSVHPLWPYMELFSDQYLVVSVPSNRCPNPPRKAW